MWMTEAKNYYKSLKFLIKNEKDQIEPKIVLSYKDWDNRVNTVCPKWYNARFVMIKPRSYERDWKTTEWFEIVLNDETDWEVRFSSSWTNPAKQFVNALAWFTWNQINRLFISCSASDYNWKIYANLRVNIDWQNGTPILNKEQKQQYITPITNPDTNEVVSYSYKKLIDFLESQYEQINAKAIDEVELKETKKEHYIEDSKIDTTDDLPF